MHDRVMPSSATATDGHAAWTDALAAAHQLALDYLTSLDDAPVSLHASPAEMAPRFASPLPTDGCPPEVALQEWLDRAAPGIVRSPGPRYFGFVTGGATPAALAGDWLASAIDQNAAGWLMSPAAAQTELTVVRWLLALFGLPERWSGVLTSGATMSNLCGLAAARQWASRQMGFDAARDGLGGHPAIPVLSSVEIHQSALKALGTLGLGRGAVELLPAVDGVLDLPSFDRALSRHQGPVIVVANAGEVNTGAFDDIAAIAQRCAAHAPGAWLHVDGAFGLYAALAPSHLHLLAGISQADSVATDAHKWLNVPYDCGVVFVRDRRHLRDAFAGTAAYLTSADADEQWNAFEHIPEFSRRFRALAAWCAVRSAGANGYRDIVERSIANAQAFGSWVAAQPGLQLMAPVHLNIVCFRLNAGNGDEAANDATTAQATEHIQRGGLAYVTGTRWQGHAAIRAAFDNWATDDADVAALQEAVKRAIAAVTMTSEG